MSDVDGRAGQEARLEVGRDKEVGLSIRREVEPRCFGLREVFQFRSNLDGGGGWRLGGSFSRFGSLGLRGSGLLALLDLLLIGIFLHCLRLLRGLGFQKRDDFRVDGENISWVEQRVGISDLHHQSLSFHRLQPNQPGPSLTICPFSLTLPPRTILRAV